jgi:LysR family transcriptional regulator, transcriptional activator of nhaA
MLHINFHHLRYFWAVAREGGMARAAEKLRVSQPSLSAQIHLLEDSLGQKLFERKGRSLALTEMGRLTLSYAEQIFNLGQEMVDALGDRPLGRPLRLSVGLANVVSKRIAHRLIEPALRLSIPVHLECIEGTPDRLVAELLVHRLDVVLADAPVPSTVERPTFSHPLGSSGISLFAARTLARRYRAGFPKSLAGAALLLPTRETALRRTIDPWIEAQRLRPHIAAEIEDSALLAAFGETGRGVFPAPTVLERDLCKRHGVEVVGRLPRLRERYYALTVERRLKHPAVVAISSAAGRTFG